VSFTTPSAVLRRAAAAALIPLCAVGGAAALIATAQPAHAVDLTSPVVLSEVYGGGGNAGSTYQNDFIEIYNSGATPVDLSGWSVQYASATGTSYAKTNISGTVAAQSFYLVQEAKGAGGTTPLPTPDVIGTIPLSGSAGKVALVRTQTALACGADCDGAADVADFVGFGTATDFAGTGPAAAPGNTTSVQRSPSASTNTGDNKADFIVADPTPKAPPATVTPPVDPCAATPLPPDCVAGTTTIQDVQGVGFVSPLKGTAVAKVAGVVTAVRTTKSRGFWMQQTARDETRASASSGIFVFTSTAPTVKVGDAVLVSGTVADYYPLASGETVATTANLSTTEISPATTVTVVSSSNPLPSALTVTATTVPGLYAPTPTDGKNIESITPIDPTRSTLEFWEAHEGMLVTVNDVRVVGPGQPQYGEIYVTTKPAELATPRGGVYLKSYAETPTGRLLISAINGVVPAANVGDVLIGATTGPVDWSTFGGYDIVATTLGAYQDNGLTPTVARVQAPDQLSVGTYNVENLKPADSADKYARLGAGVVNNLRSPDVIAVEEIQDNTGAKDDAVVAADQTLTRLTAAIVAAGGPAYTWAEIDPVNDQDGGQPGGNIRSVLLYNMARVTLAPGTPGGSLDPVAVSTGADGTASLSLNPGRVDPTNSAWTSSRKPLAGEFVFQGRKVIVVANHFNSKGGDQTADGRFQPPNRSSEVQRLQQATVLNAFVKSVLAADPNANIVLAGDFNDYQFSAPILTLTDNGATLTDLILTLPENERYTYVFNGVSQVLDHIFVSKPVTDVEYDVVHLNAEFADQASDHDPQVVRIRPSVRQGALALDPATLVVGAASTTVRLSGWYPNREFSITLDSTPVGTVTTDASGAAAYTLALAPGIAVGSHTVTATAADGATATATLTVKPVPVTIGSVFATPTTVKAGKQVVLHLVGWSPSVTVSVSLDGTTPLGTVETSTVGTANGKVVIPASTSPGSHRLVITATDGQTVSVPLQVR